MNQLKIDMCKEWSRIPQNPWLVSYPRSGRHWISMMLEKITGKRCNYYTFPFSIDGAERLWLPLHNLDFKISTPTVVYLYRRNPVDVIYSWLPAEYRDSNCREDLIKNRLLNYGKHLDHYLYKKDNGVDSICISTYEDLQQSGVDEVCKILSFLEQDLSLDKVESVYAEFTRAAVSEVHEETGHGWVITDADYFEKRDAFREKFQGTIRDTLLSNWSHLEDILEL